MGKQNRYIIRDREQSAIAESFRALSAALQENQAENGAKTILFSTVTNGESDSMTAVNTAATLAYSGKSVILVDCDMRHPVLHEIFQGNIFGVTNIIMQDKPVEEMLQNTEIGGLKILASGSVPVGPVELLSNPRLREMLGVLKTMADYVCIVSAPLIIRSSSILSDACIVASKVDGVVLVIDSRSVKTKTAKKAVELLNGARAKIVGTVLNDVKADEEFIYFAS
ncbi:MAG: CpsD/CapB family tyrosine-protein kinase [Veillonellaceae bacterium]|nr:CpsD/CapB family tyrosine-protein kinase [Veillonellaceae bacterium]